jgi:ATP-binding cassette, subfamily C, bacterial CydD
VNDIQAQLEIGGMNFRYPLLVVFEEFVWRAESNITLLEGPSGSGKTTLLRLISGQLQPETKSVWRVPDSVRLILQDDGLFPWLTARENLELVPEWPGLDKLPSLLAPILEQIRPYMQQVVGTMSFGQRRLVEILRILCSPVPLILLDEPLNFLDHSKRIAVISAIRGLADVGQKFIISSHYDTDFSHLRCERFQFVGDMPYHALEKILCA